MMKIDRILELEAEVRALRAERDEARQIVANVNNSVIGSQGYFTTPSCVEAIESLKMNSNRLVAERDALRATLADVVLEAKNVLAQFERIKQHQHEQLVLGQSLESASANWEEATMGLFIDFGGLQAVLAALDAPKDPAGV